MKKVVAAALALTAASSAPAQTPSSAGIDAYLRGDFARAAKILRPIAEDALQSDYAATFYMAAMYESGRGVGTDLTRACALYQRSLQGEAFQTQAATLWRALRANLSKENQDTCQWLARVGFNSGLAKTTFELEPGYRISFDVGGTTIGYQGRQTHFDGKLAVAGTRFLPIRHTRLSVGARRATRRHFIEIASWMPGGNPRTWRLIWSLSEVVRDTLVPIVSRTIASTSAPEPPRVFDVRSVVRLRTNDKGNAALETISGNNAGMAIIDTDEERQNVRREDEARRAARKAVDWSRAFEAHRSPSLAYTDMAACQGLVAGWSDDLAEAITIRADPHVPSLSTPQQTFDIAAASNGLEVQIHVYEKAASFSFCSDVSMGKPTDEVWKATRGTIVIDTSAVPAHVGRPAETGVVIHVDGLEVVDSSGVRFHQTRPIVLTGTVTRAWGGH